MQQHGYRIVPVNPRYSEILGERCHARLEDIPFAVDDDLITTVIEAPEHLDRKMAALAKHATQVTTDGGFFALADNVGMQAFGAEYFRLVQGALGEPRDANGRETDLFAGVHR